MKRGGFLKRKTGLKKKSKQSISLIQRKLWEHCRRIQLKALANKDGTVDCYTCPAKNLQGSNRQLGHVPWPKSTLGAFLKYDLRILKWQCMRCNQFMGGMGGDAYLRMHEENGAEYMSQLQNDRQVTLKAYDHFIELLEKYKKL